MGCWLESEYDLVVVRRRYDFVVVRRRYDLVVVVVRRRMGPLKGKVSTVRERG